MITLLVPIVLIAIVVIVVRRANAAPDATPADPHAVRRLFQYAVLYGLLVVVAVGLAGLVGRLLDRDVLIAGDEAELARDLSFVVVGGPLLAGLAWWSRRRLATDPGEPRSLGWASCAGAAALTSLVVAATALQEVLGWVVGVEGWSGAALAASLVWGSVWGLFWRLDRQHTPPAHARLHLLVGSGVGLVLAATGLGTVVSGSLRVLLELDGDDVLASSGSPLLRGAVTGLVGAPIWWLYWVRTTSRRDRDSWWVAYVLLAGAGGGLITAVVSGSALVYSVLVWVIGDPGATTAQEHFDGAPGAVAGIVVGGLVWWYHQAVLSEGGTTDRTELRRLYEHLMAAIGLVAAAVGLVLVVAALVEAVSGDALVAGAPLNTLLAAVTALGVGGSVWWQHWHLIARASGRAPGVEASSLVRRIYLVVLFGVGAIAAVIALIVAVYVFFQDVVEGDPGLETLRRSRVAVGVLITTVAVAAYHATVYRSDREHVADESEPSDPGGPVDPLARATLRYVLLVGPSDVDVGREVARRTGARVEAWTRADDRTATWSADDVLAVLGATSATEVMVLDEPAGPRVVPVHTGRTERPDEPRAARCDNSRGPPGSLR